MGALNNLGSVIERRAPRDHGDLGTAATLVLAGALLAVDAAVLATGWEPSHWEPVALVLVLAAATILGELAAVRIGPIYVSSTSCSTVLALALLGPAPAAVIAGVGSSLEYLVSRKSSWVGVTNVSLSMTSALVGAAVLGVAAPGPTLAYGAALFASGVAVLAANLLILGLYRKLTFAADIRREVLEMFLPTTPYQLLGITFATGAALIVVATDFPTLAAVVPALVVSEFILRYVAAERTRADEVMNLTRERANLLEQALTAEVAEREWIAGHVHDETLQTLAVARQDLEDAVGGDEAALRSAGEHLDAAVEELRRTLIHVHPGSVTGHGLAATLDAYASQALRRGGAGWTIDVQAGAEAGYEALLYSIGRELLSNAGKHARATFVRVTVTRDEAAIRLLAEDDGIGFPPGQAEVTGHFGLLTARRRAAAAGGRMTLSSAAGGGARVEVELPTQ